MPLKDEFTNEDEYEKALSMRDERYQEFQRQFHARPDVRDKDNAYHRAEYANMNAEMKKRGKWVVTKLTKMHERKKHFKVECTGALLVATRFL
tara:strand:+ start:621 stop:899 length:279 start_codon:yes stop_codon:yes gene_type:complete